MRPGAWPRQSIPRTCHGEQFVLDAGCTNIEPCALAKLFFKSKFSFYRSSRLRIAGWQITLRESAVIFYASR